MDTGFPSLVLRCRMLPPPDADGDVAAWLARARDFVFEATGVVTPIPNPLPDPALPEGAYRLELDGRVLGEYHSGGPPKEISQLMTGLVLQHVDEFLTPRLVDAYLFRLQPRFPSVVDAVRRAFSLTALTLDLQATLKKGRSIRDLVDTLESLLEEKVGLTAV